MRERDLNIEDWVFPIIMILLLTLLIGATVYMGYRSCSVRAEMLNLDFDFNYFKLVHCRVLVDNLWIPIENYAIR